MTERQNALHSMLTAFFQYIGAGGTGLKDVEGLNADFETREDLLVRLDRAIDLNIGGVYGHCFGCEGEIALEDLKRSPFRILCSPCEQKAEEPSGLSHRIATTT